MEKDELMKQCVLERLSENYDNDLSMAKVLEEVIKYKARILEFSEPDPENMLDIEESEKIAIDTKLILKYNQGIENSLSLGSLISEVSEPYENVLKFEYEGKEVVLGSSEERSFEHQYRKVLYGRTFIINSQYDITFLTNVSTKKRLYIKTSEEPSKKNEFEECFINYENKLDEYDIKNDEKFGEYLSDRLECWTNKQELNLEKYQLSDLEKEFLVDIVNIYNLPFALALKDGILSLSLEYGDSGNFNQEEIEGFCDLADMAFKILERFLYL